MARLNTPVRSTVITHEGAPAWAHMTPEQALRRSVLSCLLWEDEFYEDGEKIAERIGKLATIVTPAKLAALAIEARTKFNLRHVPLLLLSILARTGAGSHIVSDTIAVTIQRADELSEFLAVYAKINGVEPKAVKNKLSAQVKKGLARAFLKFDAYQLAKYDRDGAIRLRDALFLCHADPKTAERAALWKKLVANELTAPDTWEVALSGGADKKATFTRLIEDGNLGYLALLRNLRNMASAGVDPDLVSAAIVARKGAQRVLPFRYVAAARAAPQFEPAIDQALSESIAEMAPLAGRTVILVDVSGSMEEKLSSKSDLTRRDAAATLASIIPGKLRMFAFSDSVTEVAPRRGMAGVAAINAAPRGGTRLFDAIAEINRDVPYDRLIVITDEQAFPAERRGYYEQSRNVSGCPAPMGRGYMINVASNENGVGYGPWVHIDGFSEQVLRFITEHETVALGAAHSPDLL